MGDIKQVVSKLVGPHTDDAILDYMCSIIEDNANDHETLCDALSPLLLDSGSAKNDKEVADWCTKLTKDLQKLGLVGEAEDKALVRLSQPVHLATVSEKHNVRIDDVIPKQLAKPTLVDQRQLDALENKRVKKAEKRAAREVASATAASAQQAPTGTLTERLTDGGGSNIRDIKLENISLSYGRLELLTNTGFTIAYGRKYGLVGKNGSGKSTLLRAIANREFPGIPKNLSILHVEQEVHGDKTSALDCVLASDLERHRLLQEEQDLSHSDSKNERVAARLQEIYQRLEQIDAHSAESRAASILAGLSFTPAMQNQATKDFSGGWRMRISLACALFRTPDVLLLDEPTNHLDLFACLWLENYLQSWKGTLLIVSHQRDFLNAVATDIVHVHSKKLNHYKGNYDNFEKTRAERLRQQTKEYESQQMQIKHIQSFIDRWRYNAKRASMAQSRIKKLEKMVLVTDPEDELDAVTNRFLFPNPEQVNPPVLQFSDVAFKYPGTDKVLLKNLNVGIDMESRVAVVGPNGVGKSTLLRLLSGELVPSSGNVVRNSRLKWATFTQHFVDQLDLTISPLSHMVKENPLSSTQDLRSHLGSFGLSGDLALRTMSLLSGGQKSRVAMATIAWRKPHILLLDEPSNHLDMESIDSLAQGLNRFEGGVLLVSHDERLISLVCDEIWVLENNTVRIFDGDFDTYKSQILKQINTR